jgi:hypothetical protein
MKDAMRVTAVLFASLLLAAGLVLGTTCQAPAGKPGPFAVAWNYDTSGYLEVCGCSSNMLGGIARRATKLTQLREQQQVLALEGAHFIETSGEFQLFKGETIVRMLNAMKYDALVLGAREAQQGPAALRKLAELAEMPALCANLDVDGQPWSERALTTRCNGTPVAVTAVTQPEFASFELPAGVGFTDARAALDRELPKLRKSGVFVIVCLEGETTWVHQLAQDYRGQADLFLSGVRQEATANLAWQPDPPLLNNYLYGKYLGLVTVDPLPRGYQLAALTINLDESLADAPAITAVLDNAYKAQLKERFFGTMKVALTQLSLPPDSCEPCHVEAYASYTASGHAQALDTLFAEDQLYNPDCMRCHVVYDPQQDELRAMNCILCHTNITEQHIWDAVEGKVTAPEQPVTAYTYEWCSQCHDELNSLRFKSAWPQMVHQIYHGGDDNAARAAAEEMGLDYSAPPPPK